MKTKSIITRKDTMIHLEQFHLACELLRLIKHFFPELMSLLKKIKDPRHQSYITYEKEILLMTKILSSIFYIESMRKTSEEFNCREAIENVNTICGNDTLEQLPHWSTINEFLERLDPEQLEKVIPKLVGRLLRMRSFEDSRIRGKYWQILIDGTQLYNDTNPLDIRCLTKTHRNKEDGSIRYIEYYYYVLEAKLVVNNNIVISIATEFVENSGKEEQKQDCELKACYRLMEKLKNNFPRLPICIGADSLYAGEPFFRKCADMKWHYIIRFQKGSIPSIDEEYEEIIQLESHAKNGKTEDGKATYVCNYVKGIDYKGIMINVVKYEQSDKKYPYVFITDLPVNEKNQMKVVEDGRRRWKIENEGFNTQKCHGYGLEHRFSEDYNGMKNHYYLIQIGHMIAQLMENWKKLWEGTRISQGEKHKKLLESFKKICLKEIYKETQEIQIRFI